MGVGSQGQEELEDLSDLPGVPVLGEGLGEARDEGGCLVVLGEGDRRDAFCRICHCLLQELGVSCLIV